ncbi:MAG: hypothetical protein HY660_12680 [Armatimonadetes bacterium]|nr:hypothetical protein [Armatimonadota bacterium]
MSIVEQIGLAVRNYENHACREAGHGVSGLAIHLVTPNRLGYALGWVVAATIVDARYRNSAIDAIPIYHPEHGWDRFLITRRVSCECHRDEPAASLGVIWLHGADAPRFHLASGVELPLGTILQNDPERAVAQVLRLLPPVELGTGDHTHCWHERAALYPMFYGVAAELVLEFPGLVPAREIFVDAQQIEGQFHPLYLLGFVDAQRVIYDWFEVETAEYAAYFRINGEQAVYQTLTDGWSTVTKPLSTEDRAGMKRRLLAWLRLAGRPAPGTID